MSSFASLVLANTTNVQVVPVLLACVMLALFTAIYIRLKDGKR